MTESTDPREVPTKMPAAFSVNLLTQSYDEEADASRQDHTLRAILTMQRALYWQNIEFIPHPRGYPSVEDDLERSATLRDMSVGLFTRHRLQWKADMQALAHVGSAKRQPFPTFLYWAKANKVIPMDEVFDNPASNIQFPIV